jgi:hypothetical protein
MVMVQAKTDECPLITNGEIKSDIENKVISFVQEMPLPAVIFSTKQIYYTNSAMEKLYYLKHRILPSYWNFSHIESLFLQNQEFIDLRNLSTDKRKVEKFYYMSKDSKKAYLPVKFLLYATKTESEIYGIFFNDVEHKIIQILKYRQHRIVHCKKLVNKLLDRGNEKKLNKKEQ